ncbi:hypothetical protein GCM10009754_16000 [Amycolatopsis minnesotensis]|uniref:Uncharacterized protein n=1 Tax=Amycolatopsis minnesotensis TaxID=337894 RepID=A0ABP5BM12_9PSEU
MRGRAKFGELAAEPHQRVFADVTEECVAEAVCAVHRVVLSRAHPVVIFAGRVGVPAFVADLPGYRDTSWPRPRLPLFGLNCETFDPFGPTRPGVKINRDGVTDGF